MVGSETSSNTLALVRVADEQGVAAHRIDHAGQIDQSWLEGVGTVGVTAGASAPDHLVAEVVERVAPKQRGGAAPGHRRGRVLPASPALRSMISTVQALVEAGYTARRPGEAGLLEKDRTWGATEALDVVGSK